MEAWIPLALPFGVLLSVILLPGLALGASLRLRPVDAFGLAPGLSVSLVAVSAVLAPFVSLRWSWVPLAVLTVAACAVSYLLLSFGVLPRSRTPRARPRRGEAVAFFGGAIAALVIWAHTLSRVLITPTAFGQNGDNVFHLNGIRWAWDTGDGSSLTLGQLSGGSFYPAAWHDLGALAMAGASGDVRLASNAVLLGVVGVLWPLHCLFLVNTLVRARVTTLLTTGVLTASFAAFPLMLIEWGMLYPNLLGIAMVPAVLGVLIRLVGRARTDDVTSAPLAGWLLVLLIPGVAFAHPSALVSVAVASIPILIAFAVGVGRRRGRWWGLAALASIVVPVALWYFLRPDLTGWEEWAPRVGLAAALGEVLGTAPIEREVVPTLVVLLIIGLMGVVRKGRNVDLVVAWLLFGYLYVYATAYQLSDLRRLLAGGWYVDPYRLGAQLPVLAIPLIALGIEWVADGVRRFSPRLLKRHRAVRAVAVVLSLALPVGLADHDQRSPVLNYWIDFTSTLYQVTPGARIVSPDELALIERLPELVPADAVILADPWRGGALAYALSGVRTTPLHFLSVPDPKVDVLLAGFDSGWYDSAVCSAVRDLKISYVLDFPGHALDPSQGVQPGLDGLDTSPMVTLVAQQGDAKLYRVAGCR